MKHLDFELYMLLVSVAAAISSLFAYCYFGKIATNSYDQMAECLYDCNWHELDLQHQKYILVMMMNAQRPIYYNGFGVADLNLETFTTVSDRYDSFVISNKSINVK